METLFAVRITEKVVQCARIVVWNAEKDTSDPIRYIRVLESLLDHHMVFLDNGGADEPLCIVFQFFCLIRSDFICSDHTFPYVHFPEPHAKGFDGKLVRRLVFDRSEEGVGFAVNSVDTELIRSRVVYD